MLHAVASVCLAAHPATLTFDWLWRRSLLKALLPHLPRAQALLDWTPPAGAESTGTNQRARLLDLLAALLALSAPSVLDPQQPAFRFVCGAYVELLRERHGSRQRLAV